MRFEGDCTRIVLVEKLCMRCAMHGDPRRTFAHFSLAPRESIGDNPRLFATAVRGPVSPKGPRADRQG